MTCHDDHRDQAQQRIVIQDPGASHMHVLIQRLLLPPRVHMAIIMPCKWQAQLTPLMQAWYHCFNTPATYATLVTHHKQF